MYLKQSLIALALAACFCCVVSLPVVTVDIPVVDNDQLTDMQDNSAFVNETSNEDNPPQLQSSEERTEGASHENSVSNGENRHNRYRCFSLPGMVFCVTLDHKENESRELVSRELRYDSDETLRYDSDDRLW